MNDEFGCNAEMTGICEAAVAGTCGTRLIPLSHGLVALVDASDFEFLSQWHWWAYASRKTHYAVRQEGPHSRRVTIPMHRAILDAPEGVQVDHVSRHGLDNRRSNLRFASHHQNLFNHGPKTDNTSGLKGVSWDPRQRRWTADIAAYGKRFRLGGFKDRDEAGRAYDRAAKELHGAFAWLNFPEEQS